MQRDKNVKTNNDSVERLAQALRSAGWIPSSENERMPVRSTPTSPAGGSIEQIDLMQLLLVLRSKIVYIVLAALLCGMGAMFYTNRYVTPKYQASIQMIVNARRDMYTNTTVADVANAENLVATYATVIKSNRVMERVVQALELNMSWTALNGMVAVHSVNDTPVMNIVVTGTSPELCRKVVTSIADIAPEMIVEAVEAGSCKIISDAYCSGHPISPNIRSNVQKAALAGGALTAGLFVLLSLLNDTIQSEEQLMQVSSVPVLSTIPAMDGRGSKKIYGESKKKYGRDHHAE